MYLVKRKLARLGYNHLYGLRITISHTGPLHHAIHRPGS